MNPHELSTEIKHRKRNRIIRRSYLIILGLISLAWYCATIIQDPTSGPNEFMRFTHRAPSSRIYVVYMFSILIMRLIAAGFFAIALFRMYRSLQKVHGLKDRISSCSFLIHFFSMLFYIVGKTLETGAFMEAAYRWGSGFPQSFSFVSDFISIVAFLICYLAIIHIGYKMFLSHQIMVSNE